MIIRAGDMPETLQTPRPLSLKRFINGEEHSEQISMTWVHIWGHHDRIVNASCDRVYYILEGEGTFQVGDDAPIEMVSPRRRRVHRSTARRTSSRGTCATSS